MTCIPVAIYRIFINKFKPSYLKKKKRFVDFLYNSWNVHETYKILEKKKSILASLFPKLLNLEVVVT